jgi:hypothetical protein
MKLVLTQLIFVLVIHRQIQNGIILKLTKIGQLNHGKLAGRLIWQIQKLNVTSVVIGQAKAVWQRQIQLIAEKLPMSIINI